MPKKISLFRFLAVSLIIFCNLLVSLFVAEAGVAKYAGEPLSYEQAQHVTVSIPAFRKVTAKNDYIKIRYVGGDCGYHPAAFHLCCSAAVFYKRSSSGGNSPFVFPGAFVLFTLRGPPAEIAMA